MNAMQEALFWVLCDIDDYCKKYDITYYLAFGSVLGALRHSGFIPWDDDIDIIMKPEDYKRFLELTAVKPIEGKAEGYFIQTLESDPDFQCTWTKVRCNGTTCIAQGDEPFLGHLGIWVDIFPLCGAASNRFIRQAQRVISKSAYILTISENKCKKPYRVIKKIIFPIFGKKKIVKFLLSMVRKLSGNGSNYIVMGEYTNSCFSKKNCFGKPEYHDFEGRKFPCPSDCDTYLSDLYGEYMKMPSEQERMTHSVLIFDAHRSYTEYVDEIKGE